jgi:UDP-N-acetylmuramate dehydrogenase
MTATSAAPASAAWRGELSKRLRGSRVQFDAPLRPLTTLRIGGPADCLVEVESEEDLLAVFDLIRSAGLGFLVLGKGSNMLVSDAGFRGIVLRLGRGFAGFRPSEQAGFVRGGAGLANSSFVEQARALGLGGMEFLVAIPGTIGGAIAMNAGAHDGETARFLVSVRYLDAHRGLMDSHAAAFRFEYRNSPLRGQEGRIVLEGEFRLEPLADGEIQRRKDAIQQWRREHQPRDLPNGGSVFKNPPGAFAAKLIDEAGLKGAARGGAQVSEKHANFIVNRGGASAADVLALVDLIRETVYNRTGITLELELYVV